MDSHIDYRSLFQIGERVVLNFEELGTLNKAYIRVISFTTGKIRYTIKLQSQNIVTSLHNIDSVFVQPYRNEKGEKEIITFSTDNYS